MIDIHCHIFHDLDDGPRSRDVSLNMARQQHAAGVTTIIGTPHSPNSSASRRYSPSLIRERAHELQELAAADGLDVTILPGTEINYHDQISRHLKSETIIPLAGSRTVLIEMPVFAVDMRFLPSAVDLIAEGYHVVLAHPERYIYNQRDLDDLKRIHETGVLFQITANSITEKNSTLLFDHGLVDIVASDAHGDTYRPTQMGSGYAKVSERYGKEMAERIFVQTQTRLLAHS
jgi:protein-tyrosine phosphatase